MTIKLLILKSGEEMISDISEMAVGEEEEQKIIGYFLRRPCLVKMKNPGLIDKKETKVKAGFEVSLIPWIALSKDEVIPIPSDWLVTMVTPVEQLEKMYIEDVLSYEQDNQSDSTNDQPDSDQSD